MLKLGYNTTDSVVLVDEGGYQIGGRSWGPVETTDTIARQELEAGRITLVDDEDAAAASTRDEVRDAVEALNTRRDRLAAAKAAKKDKLVEALPSGVVDALPAGGDGLPKKDDLVDAVVADPAVDLGADKKTPKTTSRAAAK